MVEWIKECHYQIDNDGAVEQDIAPQRHKATDPKQGWSSCNHTHIYNKYCFELILTPTNE